MKTRCILLILCAALLYGCPGEIAPPPVAPLAQPQKKSDSPEANSLYWEGVRQFESGEYTLADEQFTRFEEAFSTDPLMDEVRLYRGRIALNRKLPADARSYFEQVYAKGDKTPLFEYASMYMGLSAFQMSNFKEAVNFLRPIVGRFEEKKDNLAVLETLWKSFAGTEDWQQQVLWVEKFLAAGPDDRQKEAALESVRDVITRQSELSLTQVQKQLQKKGAVWALICGRIAVVQLEQEQFGRAMAMVEEIKASGADNVALVEDLIVQIEAQNQADMHTIGCLLPLTGKMRLVGQDVLKGVKLAASQHRFEDGQTLNVVTIDTAGWSKTPDEAVAELVLKHRVSAIVGPMDTSFTRKAAQKAQKMGTPVVVLSTDETLSRAGSYVFQNFASNYREIQALVQTAREKFTPSDESGRPVRYVSLYPENGYGRLMDRLLKTQLESDSIDVVSLPFAPDTTDFGNVARQLAQLRFTYLFLPMTSSQLALAAPAFAAADIWPSAISEQSDVKVAYYLIPSVGYSKALVTRSGRYLQGAHFVASMVPETAPDIFSFTRSFQNKYKSVPSAYAAYGYDATQLLSAALRSGVVSRSGIRMWLDEVVSCPGLVHPFEGFNASGEPLALPPVFALWNEQLQQEQDE